MKLPKKLFPLYLLIWAVILSPLFADPFFPEAQLDAHAFLLAMLAIPLTVLVLLGLLYHLFKKQWGNAIAIVLAPIALFFALAYLHKSSIPQWTYLQFHKAHYMKEIAKEPRVTGKPLKKTFPVAWWGMAMGPSGKYSMVYDESDSSFIPKGESCDTAKNLGGHFYFVTHFDSGCNYDEQHY